MGETAAMDILSRRSLLAGSAGAALLAASGPARGDGPRHLRLRNPHTGESFADAYHDGVAPLPEALRALDRLLRDHHADVARSMDPALFDLLWRLQERYRRARGHTPTIVLLSGYRTEETNRSLRSEGAALNSYHLRGQAADVAVEGYGIYMLANLSRDIGQGGWGIYWRRRFVHLDTGPPRFWYRR